MPLSSDLIGLWAQGLWENLGNPECLNYLNISGYALQPTTLGTLNTRLGTCFVATGATGNGTLNYDVTPALGIEELAIVDSMYRIGYYTRLAMSTMGQGADSIPFTNIREDDRSISRANPVSIGAEYNKMAKEERERLDYLVNTHVTVIQGSTTPRAVDYLNPIPAASAFPYGLPARSRE